MGRGLKHTLGFPGMVNRILSVKCFGLPQTSRFWVVVIWLQSRGRWKGEHTFRKRRLR